MICASFAIACLVQWTPPAQYDYEPKQPYQIVTVSTPTVALGCNHKSLSCVIPSKHMIIISDTLKGADREAILRHEKAHLNGWVHTAEESPMFKSIVKVSK